MQNSGTPTKISTPFANSGSKNTIPVASQIGTTAGAASWTDGFPPLTMTPLESGGVPPTGQDFNGVLNALSAVSRWFCAGGPVYFDAAFAAAVGGYPRGTVLSVAATYGAFWVNSTDGNTNNPDAGNTAGWAQFYMPGFTAVQQSGGAGQTTNKVYIGWSAAGKLKLQVDSTDEGNFALETWVKGRGAYMNVLSGSGTFTVPTGVDMLRVQMVGGGGAGGASLTNTYAGGGGGAGGFAEANITVSSGQTISYSVGAGGTPAGNGVFSGNGGTSTFGSYLAAAGGGGGNGGAGSSQSSNNGGGNGGLGAIGGGVTQATYFYGGTGGDGQVTNGSTQPAMAGDGGASFFGGGGRGGINNVTSPQAPGAGGGGAWGPTTTGQQGAAGLILVRF